MSVKISKSGFREYDCRWQIDKDLNEAGMEVLGKAWGTQLQKDYDIKTALVAYDFREYSQRYQEAFIKGMLSTGIDVVNIGLQITSSAYFAIYHLKINGGAMITASHNENGWTGLKLIYGPSKTVGPHEIARFKTLVQSHDFLKDKGNLSENQTIKDAYIEDLVKDFKFNDREYSFCHSALACPVERSFFGDAESIQIDKNYHIDSCRSLPRSAKRGRNDIRSGNDKKEDRNEFRKIKVVVSTGNGTAGVFTPAILKKTGLDVIEHNTKLDWTFPSGNPNPEDVSFLESAKKSLLENHADLAVLIDGDGDRLGVLDENGNIIFNDKIGLMIARELAKDRPNSKFVIDIKSTGAWELDEIIKETSSRFVFCKTGHYYVKEKMAKLDALAGFERSGHNFFGNGLGRGYDEANQSALYLIKYLILKNQSLSDWVKELPKSFQSPTMQAECSENQKYKITMKVDKIFNDYLIRGKEIAGKKIDHIINPDKNPKFGSRIVFDDGSWGLIRASANKPVMAIAAESFESYEHLYDLVLELKSELVKFPEVSENYDQEMEKI